MTMWLCCSGSASGTWALQFAAKMSKVSKVIAVSRSDSKKDEAIKFGANECVSHSYI